MGNPPFGGLPFIIQKYQKVEVFAVKEFGNAIQLIFTAVGGWAVYFLGGCDGLLITLVVFAMADYIIGLMCAVIDKKLSNKIGFRGIYRKVLIFILVGIANILDVEVIGTGSILRTAVIFFYLSNEGVSMLENVAYLGLPVPTKLKDVLEQFHGSAPDDLKRSGKCILFHEYLVHCHHKQILKLLVGRAQRSAFGTVEFVIELPDDTAILIIRVSYLGAEITAPVTADNFSGKDAGTDPSVFSRVPYFQLPLHHVKNNWQNNRGMAVLHIELPDFPIVLFLFLGEDICGVVFLQQSRTFILFVGE